MKTRESIYDTEISPLIDRIGELCEAHSIAMVAAFQIDDGDEWTDEHIATASVMPQEYEGVLREVVDVLDPESNEEATHGDLN